MCEHTTRRLIFQIIFKFIRSVTEIDSFKMVAIIIIGIGNRRTYTFAFVNQQRTTHFIVGFFFIPTNARST